MFQLGMFHCQYLNVVFLDFACQNIKLYSIYNIFVYTHSNCEQAQSELDQGSSYPNSLKTTCLCRSISPLYGESNLVITPVMPLCPFYGILVPLNGVYTSKFTFSSHGLMPVNSISHSQKLVQLTKFLVIVSICHVHDQYFLIQFRLIFNILHYLYLVQIISLLNMLCSVYVFYLSIFNILHAQYI